MRLKNSPTIEGLDMVVVCFVSLYHRYCWFGLVFFCQHLALSSSFPMHLSTCRSTFSANKKNKCSWILNNFTPRGVDIWRHHDKKSSPSYFILNHSNYIFFTTSKDVELGFEEKGKRWIKGKKIMITFKHKESKEEGRGEKVSESWELPQKSEPIT